MGIDLAEPGHDTQQASLLPATPGAPTRLQHINAQQERALETMRSALHLIEVQAENLDAAAVSLMQRDATARRHLQRTATALHNIIEAWTTDEHIAPDVLAEGYRALAAAQEELAEGGV